MNADILWLPNHLLKDIRKPIVIYEEYNGQNYSGFYTHGTNRLTVVQGAEDTTASTIAHEFKHYLQWLAGTINPAGSTFDPDDNYEVAIRNYFRTQRDEMEALLFEYKYAKDWNNDWWLNKLVLENV